MRAMIIVAILGIVAFPSSAVSQAFGVQMGRAISSFERASEIQGGNYYVEVPSPHSEFESYIVKASPSHGVCLVRGVGIDHDNDRFGLSVQGAFESLEAILENNYGPFLKNDFLRSGALWDGSDEWVMAIRQNERVFQSVWDAEEGSTLPENLESVILQVDATSSTSAWIALQYTFTNHSLCEAEIERAEASGL